MVALQKLINSAANQFRHRQPGLLRALAQGADLLVGEVKVYALHTPIIHTLCGVSIGLMG